VWESERDCAAVSAAASALCLGTNICSRVQIPLFPSHPLYRQLAITGGFQWDDAAATTAPLPPKKSRVPLTWRGPRAHETSRAAGRRIFIGRQPLKREICLFKGTILRWYYHNRMYRPSVPRSLVNKACSSLSFFLVVDLDHVPESTRRPLLQRGTLHSNRWVRRTGRFDAILAVSLQLRALSLSHDAASGAVRCQRLLAQQPTDAVRERWSGEGGREGELVPGPRELAEASVLVPKTATNRRPTPRLAEQSWTPSSLFSASFLFCLSCKKKKYWVSESCVCASPPWALSSRLRYVSAAGLHHPAKTVVWDRGFFSRPPSLSLASLLRQDGTGFACAGLSPVSLSLSLSLALTLYLSSSSLDKRELSPLPTTTGRSAERPDPMSFQVTRYCSATAPWTSVRHPSCQLQHSSFTPGFKPKEQAGRRRRLRRDFARLFW